MSKLTLEQKKNLRADLLNGMSADDVRKKYDITQRQVRYYKADIKENVTGDTKEPEVSDDPEEIETGEVLEVSEITEDPKKSDLIPSALTESDLDPNKDYCSNCFYTLQKKTEITRNNITCPVCGVMLEWQQ